MTLKILQGSVAREICRILKVPGDDFYAKPLAVFVERPNYFRITAHLTNNAHTFTLYNGGEYEIESFEIDAERHFVARLDGNGQLHGKLYCLNLEHPRTNLRGNFPLYNSDYGQMERIRSNMMPVIHKLSSSMAL